MRRVHTLAWAVFLAAVVATATAAAPASAAPDPKFLGQATQPGKEISPCSCSAWQFGDTGTAINSYGIPYGGVIVKSGVRVGALTDPADTFQPQTVHRTGANAGTVASEGTTHNISALAGTLARFYERFPVHAGDVLGARFFHAGSNFIEYTSAFFNSTTTADEIATKTPGLAAGEVFTGSSNATKERVNVEAWMEPDEDHDGYGDVSQDLCPGSPLAATACSGSLFGSNFEGVVGNAGGAGSDTLYVQTGLNGAPTALPAPGVVVRWRVLGIPAFAREFQLRVLAPSGSGYTVAGSSAAETLQKNLSAEAGAIGSFATRLSVPAGGYVGIATDPTFTTPTLFSGLPGATMSKLADGADGTHYSGLPTTATSIVGYDADIEADADGDGYGDVSQDSCPTSASIHEGPCPAAGGGSGGGGGGAGNEPGVPPKSRNGAPTINSFTVKPKSFRAKPLGHAATRGTWGTKLKLNLSAAATVTLAIKSKAGKTLQTLTKSLGGGSSSTAFNGQIRRHGKRADLPPGTYRVSARARNDAGVSATKTASFTVLSPRP